MAGKGAGKIAGPSVHRIPCGVLAHLGDQKSGCLVEEEAPGNYWASNRSGQWGVELGATSAPGRETANPVSCLLVVSSKGNVASFGLYQALWASMQRTWTAGPAQAGNANFWVGAHLSQLLCVGEGEMTAIWVDCEDAFFVSRVIFWFSGKRRCPGGPRFPAPSFYSIHG